MPGRERNICNQGIPWTSGPRARAGSPLPCARWGAASSPPSTGQCLAPHSWPCSPFPWPMALAPHQGLRPLPLQPPSLFPPTLPGCPGLTSSLLVPQPLVPCPPVARLHMHPEAAPRHHLFPQSTISLPTVSSLSGHCGHPTPSPCPEAPKSCPFFPRSLMGVLVLRAFTGTLPEEGPLGEEASGF